MRSSWDLLVEFGWVLGLGLRGDTAGSILHSNGYKGISWAANLSAVKTRDTRYTSPTRQLMVAKLAQEYYCYSTVSRQEYFPGAAVRSTTCTRALIKSSIGHHSCDIHAQQMHGTLYVRSRGHGICCGLDQRLWHIALTFLT